MFTGTEEGGVPLVGSSQINKTCEQATFLNFLCDQLPSSILF